ncbi:MAG: phosphoribosyl-AMP cyclohydrolase [Alphaproteobacteria bacterium]|nr:phosphoribosyl-AMP cyclohydrolase [Alphaproteobacteria bacterium]
MSQSDLEESLSFVPKFDAAGLIPCIVSDAVSKTVLMFAYMNAESLELTLKTGEAHYWSRSRQSLWHKGATSGYVQRVVEMRTDCDQDCLWILVDVAAQGKGAAACHTGRKSCFYREVTMGDSGPVLTFKDSERLFDPKDVYSS